MAPGQGEKAAATMYLRKACCISGIKSVFIQVAPTPVLVLVKVPRFIWVCQVGHYAIICYQLQLILQCSISNGNYN